MKYERCVVCQKPIMPNQLKQILPTLNKWVHKRCGAQKLDETIRDLHTALKTIQSLKDEILLLHQAKESLRIELEKCKDAEGTFL